MNLLLRRLPKFREVFMVFLVAIFPIHVWSLITYFHELPAYILRMTATEMLGVLAYILVFSLFESLLVTTIAVLLTFILPRGWLLDRFLVNASILVMVSALWMIPVHYNSMILYELGKLGVREDIFWLLWGGLYLLAIWDLIMVARRHVKFSRAVLAFIDRISVLSGIFLVADILSLFIAAYRLLA